MHLDRARGQLLRDVELEAHLRVVSEKFGHDVLCIPALEEVRVALQAQPVTICATKPIKW
jgi:hypothetical protein